MPPAPVGVEWVSNLKLRLALGGLAAALSHSPRIGRFASEMVVLGARQPLILGQRVSSDRSAEACNSLECENALGGISNQPPSSL